MEQRKDDHISLALVSRTAPALADPRFDYEPLLGVHPQGADMPFPFLGKMMRVPVWVSSMTGGAREAGTINRNLARACHEFGMGMGLGSCRILLENPGHLADFDLRGIIGTELPFYANLGVVQVAEILERGESSRLTDLVGMLQADGLIIHVNPIQEWLQPEGNRMTRLPVETIGQLLDLTGLRIIVKEVGQGMGPASIARLLALPVEGFELAAFGGTNFAQVELARSTPSLRKLYEPLAMTGHTAGDMLAVVNALTREGHPVRCRHLIISGGISTFLDGYYHISRSLLPAVYGQASAFLEHARGEYSVLRDFVSAHLDGLRFARAFLKIRT